jgi:hypothetical protein
MFFFLYFDSQVILMKLFFKSLFLKEQIKKEKIQFLLKRACIHLIQCTEREFS